MAVRRTSTCSRSRATDSRRPGGGGGFKGTREDTLASILKMEFGLSDAEYERFGKLFVQLAQLLSPEAQEHVKTICGKSGNELNPFEALYLAKARADAAIAGLGDSIMETSDCTGITPFGKGTAAVVDPAYAAYNEQYGILRYVHAGILEPEMMPNTVYLRVTEAQVIEQLRKVGGDWRNVQAEGQQIIGGFLHRTVKHNGATLSATQWSATVGNSLWRVVDEITVPQGVHGPAAPAVAHVTVMFGPCPYYWWGCAARRNPGETQFDTAMRLPRTKAAASEEAGWVSSVLSAAGSTTVFTAFRVADLGAYLYIDKASELLSDGIDKIGGTTRGFLGSTKLKWLSGSPRYLRQVISWSGDDSREAAACILSMPPYHVGGGGTGWSQKVDEIVTAPQLLRWDSSAGAVGGQEEVAMSAALYLTFDSKFGQEWQGVESGIGLFPLPASMHTNDDAARGGLHKTGSTRVDMLADQMVSVYEHSTVSELSGRASAAQAEFFAYGAELKAVIKRRTAKEAALQDGHLAEMAVRLQRLSDPDPVPTSFHPRSQLSANWQRVTSLTVTGGSPVVEDDGTTWLAVLRKPKKGDKSLAKLGHFKTFDGLLSSCKKHLSNVAYHETDVGLLLSPAAVVVLMSGVMPYALSLPTAHADTGTYSISGKQDVAVIGEATCGSLDQTRKTECLQLYRRGLRFDYPQEVAPDTMVAVVAAAKLAVDIAVRAAPLNIGSSFVEFHCILDNAKNACKEYQRTQQVSTVQHLACQTSGAGSNVCSKETAQIASETISQAISALDGLDARHGASLRHVMNSFFDRMDWLRTWFEPSQTADPFVRQAMKAIQLARHDLTDASTQPITPRRVREIARQLTGRGQSERVLGLTASNAKDVGSPGPRVQKGIDYAIYMAYDPRATVYVGPLHAGLRCIPSTMMDYPARIAEKEQKGSSKGFWSLVGLIANVASSAKKLLSGKVSQFITASQVYGRKIWKFFGGYDITDQSVLLSPCAAQKLSSPYREAQEARCTIHTFMWMVYDTPMSAVLFGVTEEARDKMMMRVVDKLVELNWRLFPAEKKARPKGGHFWFSWNKRGCMYYVTELPLRLLTRGPEPWEAAPEEGQGFGRECMRYCLSLTSQERPTHNVCGLKRMAVSKSAILDTDAAMRADMEKHQRDAMRIQAPKYRQIWRELPAALSYKLPDGFVTAWAGAVDVDDGTDEGDDAGDDAGDDGTDEASDSA